MTKIQNTKMCIVYTREWEDSKTIGIYGRFMKGKKRFFVKLLQSFPVTEKRLDLYIKFWEAKKGLTFEEIHCMIQGVNQARTIGFYLEEEAETRGECD